MGNNHQLEDYNAVYQIQVRPDSGKLLKQHAWY